MEESEDANPVKKKHPSLPENYVTIAMLKERWLQRKKQEEEEEHLKLQRNPKPDPIEENPNYVTLSMLKERWLQAKKQEEELKPPDPIHDNPNGLKPPFRNRNRRKDRRGCVKEYEEGPESIDSLAIGGNRDMRAEKVESGFRERRKPRVLGNVKLLANVAAQIVASEENSGKEGGSELQLAENGVDKASGRSRSGRKKRKKGFKRNEGRMKVQQQGEEGLGENGNKDGNGFVGLAEDTTHLVVKIDERFQDLSLNDPKNANVKKRATKVKDQQRSTRFEKMAEEERRFRGGRRDRMRISSGGGGWRQTGHRRSSSTRVGGDQLVWVKKGETPGGCVTTDFNSKVPSMEDRYMRPQSKGSVTEKGRRLT
ncbi:hypothetical protein DM860_006655 [Cuscuta australis]|uniref:Uncharacterized protein n=1 Tax=Cuscuta australis TaxID=267555 RepID=A0A328D4E8_9ASTE|nr:hypothetical protein DM860_006655 [Cuscuta australis]